MVSTTCIVRKFVGEAGKWRLTVSIVKTTVMDIRERLDEGDSVPVKVEGGEIRMVDHFAYLISVISGDGDVTEGSHFHQPNSLNTNKESSIKGYSAGSVNVQCRDMDTES